jgi:hypothetical protein
MRWLGRLPAWCFAATRWLLNIGTRLVDRFFLTSLSRYGWALAFAPEADAPVIVEPGCPNVCMHCGLGIEVQYIVTIRNVLYRCPDCSCLNFYFPAGHSRPAG